jgi:hypothetical protein
MSAVPLFGGSFVASSHYLLEEGITAAKRILCALAMEHPNMVYLPLLPDLVMILLNFMSEGRRVVIFNSDKMLRGLLHFDLSFTKRRF